MGSQPVPRSDVEIYTLRNSLRSNSLRRSGSFRGDDDENNNSRVMRDNVEDMERSGSLRLSATIAAEREETRRRLSRELGSGLDDLVVEDEDGEDDESGGEEDEDGGGGGGDEEEEKQSGGGGGCGPVMSLMDLLEETDRQAGIEGPNYRFQDHEDEEEEVAEEVVVEERGLGGDGGGDLACCVCSVRLKGAETLTCGHIFCKMCTKDLWVQKGHCPVCNNYILEILDMF